ncbi:MAG: hypothetical protein WCV58_04195 [Patescibacteria group bacterium]|jgi:hypothetical protein
MKIDTVHKGTLALCPHCDFELPGAKVIETCPSCLTVLHILELNALIDLADVEKMIGMVANIVAPDQKGVIKISFYRMKSKAWATFCID